MADKYEYQPVDNGRGVLTGNLELYRIEVAERGQIWRQYFIAAFVSVGIACSGYCMGWTSPIHEILGNSTTSPLDDVVTTDQEAWIGSLLAVGAIFGPFLAGFTASTMGRKWGLITSCMPLLIGWILVLLASNVSMIYAGRFFWGVGVGMAFTICPMYCAEIATDDSRGSLVSLLALFCTVGILLIYIVGPFVDYTGIAYFGIATVTIFCIGLFFIPESPFYFLVTNDKEAATECLATIRGTSIKTVQSEIDKMEAVVRLSMERNATLADVFRGANFKAFYISCALLFFQQFCGINAVLFYLSSIFEAAGASFKPSTCAIIIGSVLVGASCIASFTVDRLGRRIFLLVSTSGTAIGLGLLGVYFILADNKNPVAANLGFLPLLALVLFVISYCAGIGPLPWTIMSELLPMEVKTTASPIATAFCWTLTFLTTRFFSSFAGAIGMGATFLVFGVCCVCGFFFTLFLVPETKGKSFQEIQDLLAAK